MPTVVLTQPISGSSSGVPGTILTGVNVPFNTTTTVDSVDGQSNTTIKWIYTLMDTVNETVVSGEILAQHRFGNNPTWNWYSVLGDLDTMKHSINVNIVPLGGGVFNVELEITNNDTGGNDWIANIVRIQLLGA